MMQSKIQEIESAQLRTGLPDFRVGDTIRVHYKIVEGDKDRIQVFQGVVTKRHRAGARSTFTVRKVSFNVGVERVFLSHSPRIDKVEVVSRGSFMSRPTRRWRMPAAMPGGATTPALRTVPYATPSHPPATPPVVPVARATGRCSLRLPSSKARPSSRS